MASLPTGQHSHIILSNRNSFLSVTLECTSERWQGPHTKSAPERTEHADGMGRMKRAKPPTRPSRVFPGAWTRATRDCRYSSYPYEKQLIVVTAHFEW